MNRPNKAPVTRGFILANCTINPTTRCWEWNRNRDTNGYGKVRHYGALERTHRVAWKLWKGEIPVGKCVLHKCDNPPCCNPNHLFVGTDADNMKDAAIKDRKRRKITISQARMIASDTRRQKDISSEYGISVEMVSMIQRGKRRPYLNVP